MAFFRSLKRIFSKLKPKSRPKKNKKSTADHLDNHLTFAAEEGDIGNVRRLLTESAADKSKHHKRLINVYFAAAASNKANVVVMLIKEYGVQPDVKQSARGKTALECAIRAGHGWTTRLLIENGADPFTGRPSPYDVARELWQDRALEMLKEKIAQVRPDQARKLEKSTVKREKEGREKLIEDFERKRTAEEAERKKKIAQVRLDQARKLEELTVKREKEGREKLLKDLERKRTAEEAERKKKVKKEEADESRERRSNEIWPDRVFTRGRGVLPPSEPSYWD